MPSPRRLSTALAGLAAVAVSAGLVLAAAPSASALLCGYPPKACPAGQVNPSTDTTVAPGILLVSNTEGQTAVRKRTRLTHWDDSPADARQVMVYTSETFRGDVSGLGRSSSVIVSILMKDGSAAPIGIVRTDRYGRAVLPAVRLSRPVPTTFMIVLQNGEKRYVTFIPQIG